MHGMQQQWIGMLVSFGLLAIVLGLRMRRMAKRRPLKVEQLWIMPAFFALIIAALYWVHPPEGMVWLSALLAFLLGLPLGWFRGKLMRIHVDPETHAVSQQGSVAAMMFIFVLVGLRLIGRQMALTTMSESPETMVAASDVLLAFGFGFVTAQRIEMGLRARALLETARSKSL